MAEEKKVEQEKRAALQKLVEAARDLKLQFLKEPLDSHDGQRASLRVIAAYSDLQEFYERTGR